MSVSIEALTAQVLAQSTRFLSRDLSSLLMPKIYTRAFTARSEEASRNTRNLTSESRS